MVSVAKRRITIFRSLTAKYALVSLIILSILSAFVYASVNFTRHMAGEAASINAAGQLRFRSYQMAWHAQRLAEEASSPDVKTQPQEELRRKLQDYDKLIQDLATGGVGQNTKPITHYSQALAIFEKIRQQWEHDIKPTLAKIATLPLGTPEVQMRALLLDYDERLPGFVDDVDDLVKALEFHYDREIQNFIQQRLLIVSIFTAAALFVAWYIRKNIVTPMRLLTRSAQRLQNGDFDVQIPVRSSDEIGTLGAVFNGMALGLKELFAEKSRKLRELDALSTISRAASESLAVDVMAGKIMDAILSLEPLALEKKGAIFIGDRDKKTLELVVSRNFSGEQVRGCGIVRYGECLCGIAAEQNEVILSGNNVHDSRHTKTYADAKEHGHIILPLISRGKLIGILCLYLPQGIKPSAEDQRLYQSMADIIAVALQNAINHRQVAMLAQSLDSSNDMIVITSTEGRIIHVNPEVLRETGYSLTELIGQPVSVMQSTHHSPGLGEEIFKTTLAAGGWRGEVVNSRRDGSVFPTLLTTSLVRAEDGQVLAMVGIARNITERKRLEDVLATNEARLKAVINNAPEVIYLKDLDGRFLLVNNQWESLFIKTMEDVIGKTDYDVFPQEMADAFRANDREVLAQRTTMTFEEVAPHADGLHTYISNKFILTDAAGSPYALCGISTDITERKKSENILRMYEYIVSASSDHLSFIDTDFVYQAVNSKYLEAFGKSGAEIVGRSVPELLKAEIFERSVRPNLERCLAGETVRYQAWFDFPAAGRKFMDVIYSPYRGVDGEIAGIVVSSRDITEHKRAEDELRKYSQDLLALTEASNSVAGITDVKTIYATICDNARKLFGVKMVWIGMAQKGTYAVVPLAHAGADDDYLASVRVTWDDSPTGTGPAGMSIKTRLPHMVNVNDSTFTLWAQEAQKRGFGSVLGVPLICSREECIGTLLLYAGEPDFFTVNLTRLCQVFANQAAIAIENARLVEGLEEKVAERTLEFELTNRQLEILNDDLLQQRSVANRAKQDAESANSAKSDFLANMSHELRTPLNSILGFSEIMRDGLAGEVNPQQKEYLNDVWESGSHLLRLINDILDISKIEAGKMELERGVIDLNLLLGEILVFFREKAARHTISFHLGVAQDLPTISADERKIKQVLINLLTNALKFTPDGGEVGVDASAEAGELRVTVWDTGIGIAPEDLGRLFQPFQQLESALTKKHEGTGLGLNLSRKIVELHGGRIWAESTPGQGSRFTFAIPIVAAAENAEKG